MRILLNTLAIVLIMCSTNLSSGVPNTIHYQGRISTADGSPVSNGVISIKFTIYDASTGGTALWNSGIQSVPIVDGLFNYDLGSNVPLPDLFGSDSARYLGITAGSDPEFAPRSQFTSSGYVFKTQKSDLALNSDSLGGLQPSFYLDWSTITNVPTGFADGVDNTGISQVTADGRYILESGDRLEGILTFDGDNDGIIGGRIEVLNDAANLELGVNGQLRAKLWGNGNGDLFLYDGSGDVTGRISATASSGGFLRVNTASGNSSILLNGGGTGDASAVLPDNAINRFEMLNEPGIVADLVINELTLNTNSSMVDVAIVTITTPTSGYIVIEGNCNVLITQTIAGATAAFQIDQISGGNELTGYFARVGNSVGYSNAGGHNYVVHVSRVYFKNAGVHTFRMEGKRATSNGLVFVERTSMTGVFYPTAYGTVTTVAEQPGDHPDAKQVRYIDSYGNTHIAYKMDLRYYEEKARTAEIAVRKAELEEFNAQTELEHARAKSDQ